MIYLNGYPFLDSKEDHTFGVPVSQVMSSHVISLTSTGMTLKQLERVLAGDQAFQGYPIVEKEGKVLVGYVGRTELRYAVEKAKAENTPPHTKCSFTTPPSSSNNTTNPNSSNQSDLDFSRYTDPTPLTVHPRLPLETVMELFKKMGPRVILIEYRGRLTGLVTIKDCLKYQFKVEAGHSGGGGSADEAGMERVFGWLKYVVGKVGVKMGGSGNVRLQSPITDTHGNDARGVGRREERSDRDVGERDAFVVGDVDEDAGLGVGDVELEDRRGIS
jgi:chloride channel 3/4/5